MNPVVSVIIPFYKAERFIAETLQSVFDQEYPHIEIIVVNDGSPQETLDALIPFAGKITIISQENKGQAEARNVGIRNAQGDIIALLDADDLWPKDHLGLMLPHLTNETPYDFVRGMTESFKVNDNGSLEKSEPSFMEVLLGSALYKRSVFDRTGLFDSLMREGEDLDWNLRLRESGCTEKRIPEVTLLYRRHDSNSTNKREFIKNGQFLSIKKKLERMRGIN